MALRLAIRTELQPWTEYFEGIFSIKYALEPLVPELSYNDLVIVDGLVATRPAQDPYPFLRVGPSALSITNAASLFQRTGDGLNSSRISSAVVPPKAPLWSFFISLYAATARRTTGCSSGVKFMNVI